MSGASLAMRTRSNGRGGSVCTILAAKSKPFAVMWTEVIENQ
jgi:hypothetical protein